MDEKEAVQWALYMAHHSKEKAQALEKLDKRLEKITDASQRAKTKDTILDAANQAMEAYRATKTQQRIAKAITAGTIAAAVYGALMSQPKRGGLRRTRKQRGLRKTTRRHKLKN